EAYPEVLESPFRLGTEPAGENLVLEDEETSSSNPYRLLLGQWVSPPATAAGTITGTYDFTIGIQQSDEAANFRSARSAWVLSPEGVNNGLLFWHSISEYTSLVPFAGWGRDNVIQQEVDIEPGDRIVIEL